MRIFIAALLPRDIKLSIEEYVESIKPLWEGVKWENYEKFHITLKFLGEVDESRLKRVESTFREKVNGISPFRMTVSDFGGFPNLRNPRVLIIGLAENKELFEFHRDLDENLESIGFERERRPFRSHVTIGRIKRRARFRGSLPSPDPLSFSISELAIIRSILGKQGSIYTYLSTIRLIN